MTKLMLKKSIAKHSAMRETSSSMRVSVYFPPPSDLPEHIVTSPELDKFKALLEK